MTPIAPFQLRVPHGVVVGRPVLDDDSATRLAATFPAEERAHIAPLSPHRRTTWIAGRLALRDGLATLGHVGNEPLLADDRGAPMVPRGFRASISHKSRLAVALVTAIDEPGARAPRLAVGIDLEEPRPPRIDLSVRVLTPSERARLPHDEDARWRFILLAFCLKEAVYKSVDPFVRRHVSFQEVELEVAQNLESDYGEARVALGTRFHEDSIQVEAGWIRVEDHIVATARARTQGEG